MNSTKLISKVISKLITTLTVVCFLVFFASFGFKDSITNGWYQQWFPNMNGSTIVSLTFLDSLTGYAVTNPGTSIYCYILKTTNGGDNWIINYTYNSGANIHFTKIQFANSNIGYASTNFYNFFKTTDEGLNWIQLSNPDGAEDMAVINSDTILVVTSDGFAGGVFRTTNGGLNWQALGPTGGSGQPGSIYMFNKDIGFCLGGQMRKTTNGGVNWFAIPGETYSSIQLVDSLVGWKTYAGTKKTTNGGLNWVSQQLPNLPHSWVTSYIFALNKDSVWLVGDQAYYAPLYKTTNGGINWGYQRADTSVHITVYDFIDFSSNKIGWANSSYYNSEIHTFTCGNDTTFFTRVNNNITSIPKDYILEQNYPNPFNSITNVKYKITKSEFRSQNSEVRISVFDISGKKIEELLSAKQSPGDYEVKINGNNLSSGIYFYTLFVDGMRVDTKKAILLK